ncbi:MAG: hypothetical protein LBG75_01375 [Candidatus Nomurabacteria bacterium]|jgi:hypothetical protein|nr:hypothetical protein [Candidatus Nomurabacteria bacterium]
MKKEFTAKFPLPYQLVDEMIRRKYISSKVFKSKIGLLEENKGEDGVVFVSTRFSLHLPDALELGDNVADLVQAQADGSQSVFGKIYFIAEGDEVVRGYLSDESWAGILDDFNEILVDNGYDPDDLASHWDDG